jgi:hypothetical protein
MGDESSEHTTYHLWDHFAGKMPANDILYNIYWAEADERRARIITPAEKKNHGCRRDWTLIEFKMIDQYLSQHQSQDHPTKYHNNSSNVPCWKILP